MSKVVIVANAKIKEDKKIGNDINNFDKVIRMNRFETDGFEEYLGSKTDIWCINRKILLQKTNTYYGFYNKRWESYKDKYPTLEKCVMMTYCHEIDEADGLRRERIVTENDIHVANTHDVMNELRQRWIDIYNNDGFHKPGTGITTILYYIKKYGNIHLHNFDWGKTSHYWGVKGPEDIPSQHHTWGFEEQVAKDLVSENKVVVL